MEAGTYSLTLKGGDTPQVEKAKLTTALEPQDGKYVFDKEDPRFHAANSFSAVARTIKLFEEGTGHSISWSFKRDQIDVNADKGEMLNAYYQPSDGSMNFFHSLDPVTGKTIFSGDSGEVVSHETGHAILDSMRPNFLYNWRSDVKGFHESFGDMLALVMSVQDDRALAKVVEQTGGDMSKQNMAAALGEELGITINHTVGRDATGGDFTRNAINNFTWKDPKTLEENPKDPNQLGSEAHNFSRLFTGAFYDIFSGMVDANRAAGMDPATAIREASNEGIKVLARAVEGSPKIDFTYKKMAEVFIATDKAAGGKNAELMTSVFKKREILPAGAKAADIPALIPNREFSASDAPLEFDLITLDNAPGNFAGAQVEVPVDPDAVRDPQADADIRHTIEKHIKSGDILYTEPNQTVEDKDLFKATGEPYAGVLRWKDGQAVIERNRIVV